MWPRRDKNSGFVESLRSMEIRYGSRILFWLLMYNQDCVNDIGSVEHYENRIVLFGNYMLLIVNE